MSNISHKIGITSYLSTGYQLLFPWG